VPDISSANGELKQRAKLFGLRSIKLASCLPKTMPASVLGKQLVRSATSVGANYRSACRSRSRAEFASKIGIVVEEADEAAYWLEMIIESNTMPKAKCGPLLAEADELVAIFSRALITIRSSSSHSPKRQLRQS
jgi:four helix bundle protein